MTIDPIRKRLEVRLGPDDAFRLFAAGIGSWWPLDSHPRAEDDQQTKDVVFEGHVGGRIYEIVADGTEGYWGTVTAWEPLSRVMYDRRPSDDDRPHTEVEVRFSPAHGGGTMVELEHRG